MHTNKYTSSSPRFQDKLADRTLHIVHSNGIPERCTANDQHTRVLLLHRTFNLFFIHFACFSYLVYCFFFTFFYVLFISSILFPHFELLNWKESFHMTGIFFSLCIIFLLLLLFKQTFSRINEVYSLSSKLYTSHYSIYYSVRIFFTYRFMVCAAFNINASKLAIVVKIRKKNISHLN